LPGHFHFKHDDISSKRKKREIVKTDLLELEDEVSRKSLSSQAGYFIRLCVVGLVLLREVTHTRTGKYQSENINQKILTLY